MIHWTRLPPPVRPNRTDPAQWYDHSGSYDGGVSLLPAALGGPTIVYDVIECRSCKLEGCLCINGSEALTAAAPMDPPWMGIARPLNSSDPYLLTWEKDPQNPINFTGGPQTGGANPGSIWWNEQLEHFNLLALSHGGAEGEAAATALAPEVGTMGKMYRYETRDRTFHNWTRHWSWRRPHRARPAARVRRPP
eukprot:COSAG04_NODE_1246_length_7582_cov_2.322555_9_plen_192_part_01